MTGIGLIGIGAISPAHLEWLTRADGWDVVAVCDVDAVKARACAERYGVANVFDNASGLIACDDVEVVDIATPPAPRFELAHEAIAAGKHLLCEKPLCLTAGAADELAELAGSAGLVNALCHEYRYHPAHVAAKRLIDDGSVGEVRMVTMERTASSRVLPTANVWLRDPAVGGGFLLQTLSHSLDLVQWMCGPIALDGAVARGHLDGGGSSTMEDVVVLSGAVGDSAVLSVVGGWTVHQPIGTMWRIHGSLGTVQISTPSHRTADEDTIVSFASGSEAMAPVEFDPGLPGEQLPSLFEALATDVLRQIDDPHAATSFATFADAAQLLHSMSPARRGLDRKEPV